MRRSLGFGCLLACALGGHAADVGLSLSVAQPGLYGRVDIGNVPPPVMYAQPMLIQPAPVVVAPAPVYLHVPPGHARHWRRHCAEYGACGVPVYFVQERWYRDTYGPRHAHPGHGGHRRHDEGHGHGHRHHASHGHGDR